MNNQQIKQYQNRLFYKLFATLPGVKKANEFNKESNFDFEVNNFYFFKNKDFWFTRSEKEDKYLFLFGVRDKPLKNISGNDVCLIIDFDKNIQFNNDCLGLFSIKNSQIHILINFELLKEKYPYFNTNLKITNIKSFDDSLDLQVIDLGNLDDDVFIDNLEKLINECSIRKSSKEVKEPASQKIKNDSDMCELCSKKKSDYKIDSNLNNLKNLKPELCGRCIEKIVVSEFYTKITPLLKGNMVKDITIAKEKFGNDRVFEIGLKLLEKYKVIQYIGVKKLFFTLETDSYLIKKYIKYSDKDNLLIDNIIKDNKSKPKKEATGETGSNVDSKGSVPKEQMDTDEKPQIPRLIKTDVFGNRITINQMNIVLEDLANGKSEGEAIAHANVSKSTYDYWINRGKQDFGELYVQFYNYVNEFKSEEQEPDVNQNPEENKNIGTGNGMYEPILDEYKMSLDSVDKTGIAWVNKNGIKWYYSRNINGKTVRLSAHTIPELYEKVVDKNLIWGIRDYDKAKEFIDFPDDFEIPVNGAEEGLDKVDLGIYAPLAEEYENSFSSTNKSGIAWVNHIGNRWIYSRIINGNNMRFVGENVYELYTKVKESNQIWGIRDYDKAKEFIDFPDDFEIPLKPSVGDSDNDIDVEIDPGIYAPLAKEYEKSFSSMNKSGIAWVTAIGNKWYYAKSVNGKNVRISGENIYKLYEKVKKSNQIWGIRDYDKAKELIDIPDDFEILIKQETEEDEIVSDNGVDESIYAPLSRDKLSKFNPNPSNKSGIAWVSKIGNNWIYKRQRNGKTVMITDPSIVKLHEKVIKNNQIWGIIDIEKARKVIESDSFEELDSEIPNKPENEEN